MGFSIGILDKLNNDNNANFFTNGDEHLLKTLSTRVFKSEKSVVFDVGANKGDWSKLWLSGNKNTEIHLFEPSHLLYKALKNSFYNNPNIFISTNAVGDNAG